MTKINSITKINTPLGVYIVDLLDIYSINTHTEVISEENIWYGIILHSRNDGKELLVPFPDGTMAEEEALNLFTKLKKVKGLLFDVFGAMDG